MSAPSFQQVAIRPVELSDADEVQRYASDARLAATCNVPHPYPDDGGRQFVQRSIIAREKGERYPSAVIVGGKFAGLMGLNAIDLNRGKAELDYWIAVPFWGHGVGTAAARLAVALAFRGLKLQTVFSGCLCGNPASCRVLEKVGFTEIETIINDGTYGQKFDNQPIRRFKLDRADWEQRADSRFS